MKTPVFMDQETLDRAIALASTKGFISARAASPILGLHLQTIYKYIRKGWIRTITVGKRECISYDEIIRYKTYGNYEPNEEEQAALLAKYGDPNADNDPDETALDEPDSSRSEADIYFDRH